MLKKYLFYISYCRKHVKYHVLMQTAPTLQHCQIHLCYGPAGMQTKMARSPHPIQKKHCQACLIYQNTNARNSSQIVEDVKNNTVVELSRRQARERLSVKLTKEASSPPNVFISRLENGISLSVKNRQRNSENRQKNTKTDRKIENRQANIRQG